MLKRNGETCEHSVPGWPGLLTDSEQRAYKAALASFERELREFNDWTTALDIIEKQIPQLATLVSTRRTENNRTIQNVDGEWQIHQTLRQSARSELLLCSRQTEQGAQFGIMERFADNSLYARTHGKAEMLLTSNRPALLLQDFVENERYVLQLVQTTLRPRSRKRWLKNFRTWIVAGLSGQFQRAAERNRRRKGKTFRLKNKHEVLKFAFKRPVYERLQLHVPQFFGVMFES